MKKVNELNLWVCCWASARDDNEKSEYVKILLLLRPLKDDRWGSFVGMNVLLTNVDPLLLVLLPTYVESTYYNARVLQSHFRKETVKITTLITFGF